MLYDIGFLIFSLFYLPTLLLKGKLHRDFLERFGIFDEAKRGSLSSGRGTIWIEAVSMGEVALCRTLIPKLKKSYPDRDIVLSTITKAGNDLANVNFSEIATIIYFPLDFSCVTKTVTALIRPELYIMIETEIWPNLLRALSANNVPAVLMNGRISDRSFVKYRLAKPFLKKTLALIKRFYMRSEEDRQRAIELGAPPEKVTVTGNMKFDITASPVGHTSIDGVSKLFVAGSTHEGEEEPVLAAFVKISREFPGLRLLIAPRHINRCGDVAGIVKRFGFAPVRVSALKESGPDNGSQRVMILDTVGQLNAIYSLATLVFIGGSLVKYGGHNPIEPAVFAKPIIFGPHMFNFSDIARLFISKDAALEARDERGLFDKCVLLLRDEAKRLRMGENGRRVVSENSGATERNISALKEFIADA